MNRLVVVDPDRAVATFIAQSLRLEGFAVSVAGDAAGALAAMVPQPPELLILDVRLPDIDGLSLCRRLRTDPATANLPIILVSGRGRSIDKVNGLSAGADDYVTKPFDMTELVARVRSILRRSAEMRAMSPLTGLPGNYRIDREIAYRLGRGLEFAVCHVDLDNFKAFNDAYGFLRGDEVISLLASCLHAGASACPEPAPFIGHVGGDDFVVVCHPDQAEPICRRTLEVFDHAVIALHDPTDAARGHLEVRDRQGNLRCHPLVSVSVGIAVSGRRRFGDYREVVAVAAEMKSVAKQAPGSAIAVDRRGSEVHIPPGQPITAAPVV